MTERLAMITSDKDDLINQLSSFTHQSNDQKGMYTGNPKHHTDKKDILVDGEEGKVFINAILQSKNLSKIAKLWVLGTDIDWQLLYNRPPKRIPLPAYPFEKKAYWIHKQQFTQNASVKSHVTQLHPLVHQNISNLDAQQFSTQLTDNEFFLTDHVIANQKTLPGVAYLEMALSACRQSTNTTFFEMADIVWIQPIIIGNQQQEIVIQLYPSKDQIEFQIKLNLSENQDQLCTQGKLIARKIPPQQPLNIHAIQSRCPRSIETR